MGLPLLLLPGVAHPVQEVLPLLEVPTGELPPQIPLQVQQAELMLRIGEEFRDHPRESAEVIGDKEEHPMDPAADQVLEDLSPEALVLPAT